MRWARREVYPVKGVPWLEDMDQFPSRTIQVEVEGTEKFTQESLWHLIRPFGRIKSIELSTAKEPSLKVARVTLESVRAATVVRNCLHGYRTQEGTSLRVSYVPSIKAHAVRSWLSSHPKIVLPVLVLLLGGVSYAFFDPIRTFFIKSHISGALDVHQYQIVNWLEKETRTRFSFFTPANEGQSEDASGASVVEVERNEALDKLRGWISGLPETFVVISGPKGSGKGALVEELIRPRKNVLVIDCEKVCKDASSERRRVANLAKEVGYFPYFTFLGSINHLIDLGSVGLIGQKAGFESSSDTEIRQLSSCVNTMQILDLVEVALAKVSEEVSKQIKTTLNTPPGDSAEVSVQEKTDFATRTAELHRGYSNVPVVVLKGFCTGQANNDDYLWDGLAEWASRLTEKKIAHVVFTSENVGVGKPLSKALSSRPMNLIHLTDANPDSALQYIARQMARPDDRAMILNPINGPCIAKLGGRLTELDKLIEKIKAGVQLEVAVEEIVMRSVMEIKKKITIDGENGDGGKWNRTQVWGLIRALDMQDELMWHATVVDLFDGDESGLYALEDANLITIVHQDLGGSVIRIGKPIYRTAIRRILEEDVAFTAYQDRIASMKKLKKAEEEIKQKIGELVELAKLFPIIGTIGSSSNWSLGSSSGKLPDEIKWKVEKTLKKLKTLQGQVDQLEKSVELAKKGLAK
ncbi:uncharacterized protein MELLADRAFT_91482 [Melampsora larici-populina 98AG31]|uniref:Mitochondrial escape protein 2 n=1 Tax=Melampsora larici-populina (strain 98AG31 / pathotype 3-4-7) TaxID=747676 RepID=F4RZ76_MELLP|nr:uncharacterized protein MELLADRAFT_91482 [Melampsora larici-populina 98AG31]EGG02361.1 hypothetical protein MELLADRAFT_91482 [Melampsora larici-populina 98AG31]